VGVKLFDSSLRGKVGREQRADIDGFAGRSCTEEQVKVQRLILKNVESD
jgi:hypothetical protein